jgi:ABC-2 type transport system permease protein
MTAVIGIVRRELKVAFTTPVAYIVLFLFTFFSSIIFNYNLQSYEERLQRVSHFDDPEALARINFTDSLLLPMFLQVELLLILVVCLLTMRTFAEEKKQKTMELLMTSPIEPWHVVLGKYLAYLVIVAAVCAITLIYPVILTMFGTNTLVNASVVDWPTTLLGIAGIFLAGMSFGALGFFFSAATDNQVVAVLLSMVAVFVVWISGLLGGSLEGFMGAFLVYIGPASHIGNLSRGILDLADVSYFVSMAVFFLVLTHQLVEGQRWR